jgi:alpha-L-fucosidase
MPEWYNPNVGRGGWGFGTWPGFLAPNAYDSSKKEPYTGSFPEKDWLRDEQLAKMRILAVKYETEIMVCSVISPPGS